MTLLQFFNTKLGEDSPIGDLANDVLNDKEFLELTTDSERISYLERITINLGNLYPEFLKEFNSIG